MAGWIPTQRCETQYFWGLLARLGQCRVRECLLFEVREPAESPRRKTGRREERSEAFSAARHSSLWPVRCPLRMRDAITFCGFRARVASHSRQSPPMPDVPAHFSQPEISVVLGACYHAPVSLAGASGSRPSSPRLDLAHICVGRPIRGARNRGGIQYLRRRRGRDCIPSRGHACSNSPKTERRIPDSLPSYGDGNSTASTSSGFSRNNLGTTPQPSGKL